MVVSAETQRNKDNFEKAADIVKVVSIGFLGIGALIGASVMVGASLIDLGIIDPLTRELIQGWRNLKTKVKGYVGSKSTDQKSAPAVTMQPVTTTSGD